MIGGNDQDEIHKPEEGISNEDDEPDLVEPDKRLGKGKGRGETKSRRNDDSDDSDDTSNSNDNSPLQNPPVQYGDANDKENEIPNEAMDAENEEEDPEIVMIEL